jgi:hypothetical protein
MLLRNLTLAKRLDEGTMKAVGPKWLRLSDARIIADVGR